MNWWKFYIDICNWNFSVTSRKWVFNNINSKPHLVFEVFAPEDDPEEDDELPEACFEEEEEPEAYSEDEEELPDVDADLVA